MATSDVNHVMILVRGGQRLSASFIIFSVLFGTVQLSINALIYPKVRRPTVRKQMFQGQRFQTRLCKETHHGCLDSICNGLKAILEASFTPLHNPAGMIVDSDVINCAGPN